MSATLDSVMAYILSRLRSDPNRPAESAFYCKHYKMAANCFNFSSVNSADWNFVLEAIKKSEHRWLCFVDSKAIGQWLQEQLGKDSLFIDSEGSMKNGRVAGEIEFITKNEAFRPKVLIATSILDNGINLKMPDLKGIVIDCNNRNQLIQMAGRKRPQNVMDTADLYLIDQPRKKLLDQLRRLDSDYAGYIRFKQELDLYGWPNTSFSQNSFECDQYRNRMTWSETEKLFRFNYLGFNEIQMKRGQLGTLLESEDAFQVKVNWIFGNLTPRIGVTIEQIVHGRNQQLVDVLSKYAGKSMPIKSDKVLALRQEFSHNYLEINGSDATNGVRSNRTLSIPQIQEVVKKYSLPVEIQKLEIDRKVHIFIKALNQKGEEEC